MGATPGQCSEGGFVAYPAGMGPADEDLGGGDDSDTGQGEQFRCGCGDELVELVFQVAGLGFEEQCLPGAGAQRADGAAMFDVVLRQRPEAGAAVELGVGRAAPELVAYRFRSADDQGLELADRLGAGGDGARAGGEQHPHRLAVAAPTRLCEVVSCERFSGGADGVELVGLGAVASCRAGGSVDLDHPFLLLEEVSSQAGAEAAGAFDGPDAASGRVVAGEGEHSAIPERIGG